MIQVGFDPVQQHVPEISGRKPFRARELTLQIQADLLHNSASPGFLRLSHHKISSELPVKIQLFRIHFNRGLDLRVSETLLYIVNPLYILLIQMHIVAFYDPGNSFVCHLSFTSDLKLYAVMQTMRVSLCLQSGSGSSNPF